MARGSLLNDIEKGEILAFSDAGLNRTDIARKIGHSRNTVANFMRAPGEYGIKKSGERPTKLGKRKKRRIMMMTSNSMTSLDETRSNYCPTRPSLTAVYKKARMDFARAHMSLTSEWTEVILPFPMCMCLFSTSFILSRECFFLPSIANKFFKITYSTITTNSLRRTSYFNKTTMPSTEAKLTQASSKLANKYDIPHFTSD
uniref:HTH_Tnp_Tc3_1 domain-containing protein n=1 Tax=Heterorhabditis bacteriophora TaxID=37862 RepID=A0A1I7WSM4_HETBA